ncbi:secretion system protein [Halobacteriales archaeon SW_8_65_20]|nr:MAG: secretion system protein [Halobacteriales archaeon SW_8_65_20]
MSDAEWVSNEDPMSAVRRVESDDQSAIAGEEPDEPAESSEPAIVRVEPAVRPRDFRRDDLRLGPLVGVPSESDLYEEITELRDGRYDNIEQQLSIGQSRADALDAVADERTLDVPDGLDEDDFFTTARGHESVVTRYDLEKTVPMAKKPNLKEIERYWVNEPYSFIVIYRSTTANELKYYAVEPHLNAVETEMHEFLVEKLSSSLKYAGDEAVVTDGSEVERADVIEAETMKHVDRYGVLADPDETDTTDQLRSAVERLGFGGDDDSTREPEIDPYGVYSAQERQGSEPTDGVDADLSTRLTSSISGLFGDDGEPDDGARPDETRSRDESIYTPAAELPELKGRAARPESVVVEEDADTLTTYQLRKIVYYLKRDFIGYQIIDPVKHDINVEDISVDGYNMPVFVYHTEYEQIISNMVHGKERLDEFAVKLAQRSGKGISKRQPQVDCTLPDGSRAQLTLGKEVSDHGTNYTIRQFKDVPFTPVDLINWNTFGLDQMAFLWLAIENNKSLIFAGGTASGKTTSLNAVSLFIPSKAKIVSIEDTREVELPQRNWVASVTRPSFSDDDKGDVDEFDLLEAALRQRPEYIVMGEIRGEEGRTLFQVMSTGHTTYTTFHADSVGEVMKRFTTDPINVSKTMFTALDLVSIQAQTRVEGRKVRRNQAISAINDYDAENNEINVEDVFVWSAERDSFDPTPNPSILERIRFDRGWTQETLDHELFVRKVMLAYLIRNGLNRYTEVAGAIQAFINDPDTILALMANGRLFETLDNLRDMESVEIDVDPEKEALVPRPNPDEAMIDETRAVMEKAEETLFPEYRDSLPDDVTEVLADVVPDSLTDAGDGTVGLGFEPSTRGTDDPYGESDISVGTVETTEQATDEPNPDREREIDPTDALEGDD